MFLMNWVIWIERAVSLQIMGWQERIVYLSSEALALMAVWYWFLLELLKGAPKKMIHKDCVYSSSQTYIKSDPNPS